MSAKAARYGDSRPRRLGAGAPRRRASSIVVRAAEYTSRYAQIWRRRAWVAIAVAVGQAVLVLAQTACAPPVALPDLTVAAVGTPAKPVAAGARLQLAATVVNTGAGKAGRSRTAYFLVRGGRRIRLGARSARALPPHRRARASVALMVPAGTAGGHYRPEACANAGRRVAEATTRNNCRVAPRSVRVLPILPAAPARAFWGARVGTQLTGTMPPWDMAAQAQFERGMGKRASLIHWGAPWQACTPQCHRYEFDTKAADNARKHGAISLYDWAPYTEPDHGDAQLTLRAISHGDFDGLIRGFAAEVRDWGHVLFLRLAWEMNGNFFQWGVGVNGNKPATFVRAWRRVHDVFASAGATNVVWVWCPNVDPRHDWAPFASVYPGDAYVDWTCLDGYNSGTNPRGHHDGWHTFDEIYRRSYDELSKLAPSKPMMIGEVASTEWGGSKAGWIRDMFARLRDYPRIRGLSWTNDPFDGMDWPIESSAAAGDAFRTRIRSSYFSAGPAPGG